MNVFSDNIGPTLGDGTEVKPLILRLLERRGVSTEKEIRDFLEPQLKDLPSPALMANLEKASAIIGNSVIRNNPILIWGDYDVDGITATSLLLLFFKAIQHGKIEYYIPDRLNEGYGLQGGVLGELAKNCNSENKVLITVDNGISAHDAVLTANSLGYKVIVTDHHTPPEKPVSAAAILNPRQKTCSFPGENLSGVGVAFYLACGVRAYLQQKLFFNDNNPKPNVKQFLGLVALGTIADMVELDTTNRILIRAGLEVIAKGSTFGISALCAKSSVDPTVLRSEDIAFQLAPKINAAGRLGVAGKAVSLLVSESRRDADMLCVELIKLNEHRKYITLRSFDDALRELALSEALLANCTIVAGEFHIGVAGIVASKLVEKFQKPAIVLSDNGAGLYKGSARSVKGVNLYDALRSCEEMLVGFGGHAMAAGMSLEVGSLRKFQNAFDAAVYEQNGGVVVSSEESSVEEVRVRDLFEESTLQQLLLLEPHGTGNPEPVFRDTSASLSGVRCIGKDKSHLRFDIKNGSSGIKGIAFGAGELSVKCESNLRKSILYSPSVNFFKGRRNWQARVVDIQFSGD